MFETYFRVAAFTALAAGSALAIPGPVEAAPIAFSGTARNQNAPAAPDPSCAPLPLRVAFGPAGTSGQSNLGAFTYTQNHCAAGPGPYSGGVFQFIFADDQFSGSYSGVLGPSGTPGLLNNSISYVIEQGTGRFIRASGTINGTGTLDVRLAQPLATLKLNGVINSAVPEPATWAMLIVGFGLVGGTMRRRGAPQRPLADFFA